MSNAKFIDAVENNNIDIVLQMIDEVKGNSEGLYKLLTSRNGLLRFTPLMIAVRRDYIEISGTVEEYNNKKEIIANEIVKK